MKKTAATLVVRRCLASLGAGGVLLTGWGQDESPPVVGTLFEIQARAFVDNLQAHRFAIEADLAADMAAYCADHFRYLSWEPVTNAASGGRYRWVFKATMVSVGSGSIPGAALTFAKQADGTTSVLSPEVTLYGENDLTQPTQDEAALRADLRRRIREHLGNEQNVGILQERFLAGIPVTQKLEVDAASESFLLPLPWGRLLAGEGSLLRAQYSAERSANLWVPVRVKLAPSEDWGGRVGCSVREFSYPPIRLKEPVAWTNAMPESLSKARRDSIVVFMDKYVRDYTYGTTTNGLVLPPFSAAGTGGSP